MSAPSIVRPGPDRVSTVTGLLEEYRLFAKLIGGLDASDWRRETRCAGWQVRDIAGHVVGQAVDTVTGVLGSRTPDDQAVALRGESPTALATRLYAAVDSLAGLAAVLDGAVWSAPSPVPRLTIGQGVHALRHDAYLHGDDIRAAVGLPFDIGSGMWASLDFVLGALLRDEAAAAQSAIARLLGLPVDQFSEQTGIAERDFLLVATGRGDPASLLLPDLVNIYR